MRKVYNFNAGPALLPEEVLLQAQADMLDWNGTGMSVMEIGHRGVDFKVIAEQSEADLRELMSIPDDYHVLFTTGGSTAQFAMVPLNLLNEKNKMADYVDTGVWSKKAIDEAKRYGHVNIVAETKIIHKKMIIPEQKEWSLHPEASYLHYTPNETIEGIRFPFVPDTDVPLVADMTSMILSEPFDVTKFGVIYAGAQKNVGQAGITLLIVRDDMIKAPLERTPTLYSYKVLAENKSLYNTPPTYAWYITALILSWLKKQGGVRAIAEINKRKSEKIYSVIDEYPDFYINNISVNCRSRMNVPFNLPNAQLTDRFLDLAAVEKLKNLKGHRVSGGVRASIYNAMPESGVDRLVDFMHDFVKKNG